MRTDGRKEKSRMEGSDKEVKTRCSKGRSDEVKRKTRRCKQRWRKALIKEIKERTSDQQSIFTTKEETRTKETRAADSPSSSV